MTFDNSKTIISLRIKLFGVTVIALAYMALAYVAKIIKFPLLGMNDVFWTVLFITIWILIAFLPMFLSYQYISYSDDGDNIVFRYFTTGIVGGRKNSVEISKRSFSGYKIESRFFGFIKILNLFQNFQEGTAKYPPIYISSLTREERNKIVRSLNSLSSQA